MKTWLKIKQMIMFYVMRWAKFTPPVDTNWKPGYVRYFTILQYPKEGWINTFHNYDDEHELQQALSKVFADDTWGPMISKDVPQIVIKDNDYDTKNS